MHCKIFLSFLLLSLFITTCLASERKRSKQRPGGLSQEKPADETIRELFRDPDVSRPAKRQIQSQRDSTSSRRRIRKIKPLAYKSQVVSGVMYYVRTRVTDRDSYQIWWIKIYEQSWNDYVKVVNVTGPQDEDEEVAYF
ncbi:unnamed protein product [Allacma fusca]|uniref:Cystatin domain-containing protein n=1 Tax=Allacma fusca TaxID=39272 RepID=A0A8J2JLS1_9HEXA|nr:unnamed protein product [Allacma fusca]